ncbi:MAG: hypothetical protein PSY14_16540 [bacterium]|nr:hypothetical protein [bacterium]
MSTNKVKIKPSMMISTRDDLKKAMREIKASIKAHKNLLKNVFGDKTIGRSKGGSLISASRKKIQALFGREEKLVQRLLAKYKKPAPAGN